MHKNLTTECPFWVSAQPLSGIKVWYFCAILQQAKGNCPFDRWILYYFATVPKRTRSKYDVFLSKHTKSDIIRNTDTNRRRLFTVGVCKSIIGVRRLELRASWSQATRATICATPRSHSRHFHIAIFSTYTLLFRVYHSTKRFASTLPTDFFLKIFPENEYFLARFSRRRHCWFFADGLEYFPQSFPKTISQIFSQTMPQTMPQTFPANFQFDYTLDIFKCRR